ncbi:MAG TPA: glycoside hydrolase family 3 C-terminal domain-containing protein [Acidimicrobiales bacterium]|nr:glycoside hydrolase family 3 C-terminal domain-containing protein [Acidimicrobiales bacterium]
MVIPVFTAASTSSGATAKTVDHHSACPSFLVRNTSLSPLHQAEAVLARMTLSEKVAFIGLAPNYAAGIRNMNPGVPRLCIPPLILRDGPNGIGEGATGVTGYPAEIALAATFDPTLARQMGEAMGREAKGQGDDVLQGPSIDVSPFANWGRNFESFGESPEVASQLGASIVRGIQSTGTIAMPKDIGPYVQETNRFNLAISTSSRVLQEVYLAPFKGAVSAGPGSLMCSYGSTNGVNTCSDAAVLSEAHQWGFTGFVRTDLGAVTNEVAALKAGVDMFKPYDPSQITQALSNKVLSVAVLNAAILRVLSTMFTFHDVIGPTKPSSTRTVTSARNTAVALSVAARAQVLLTNKNHLLPLPNGSSVAVFGSAAGLSPLVSGRGSAYVAGTGDVSDIAGVRAALPSSTVLYDAAAPNAPNVATVGSPSPSATLPGFQQASVQLTGNPSGLVDFSLTTVDAAQLEMDGEPVIQAFDSTAGGPSSTYEKAVQLSGDSQSIVLFWRLGQTVPTLAAAPVQDVLQRVATEAAASHYAIVVVGDQDSEGIDRTSLALPGYQDQLVAAVAAANPRTLVIVHSGGPVLMPWIHDVAAVIEAWYTGQEEGTAVGSVVSGKTCPSGRLPMTFPTSDAAAAMLPLDGWPTSPASLNLDSTGGLLIGAAYYRTHGITPLFPFGYGLSCTTFAVSRLSVSRTSSGYDMAVRVANSGSRAGREEVQAYVTYPSNTGEPPLQLKSFGSISVPAHATRTVTLALPLSALSVWMGSHMTVIPGEYDFNVGTSSADLPLSAKVSVP